MDAIEETGSRATLTKFLVNQSSTTEAVMVDVLRDRTLLATSVSESRPNASRFGVESCNQTYLRTYKAVSKVKDKVF